MPTISSWYLQRVLHRSSTPLCSSTSNAVGPDIFCMATNSAYSITQRPHITWLGASCTAWAIGNSTSRKCCVRLSTNSRSRVDWQTGCAIVCWNWSLNVLVRSGCDAAGIDASGESVTSIPSRTPAGPCAAISWRLTFQGAEEPAYQSICWAVSSMPHTVLGVISSHPGGYEPFANSTRRTSMASLRVEYEPALHISSQRTLLACAVAHNAAGTKQVALL